MWHEVRKQERKIRCMIVDYKRRAERRKDYYEKIKADPTQFLQIHGRPCKIHLDPAVAMAGDSPLNMMPWQGSPDVIIDRFDVRAHLDYIPDTPKEPEGRLSYEDRHINYERYRILVQNDFLGVGEEKFLHQLHLEEQFGAVSRSSDVPIEGKKKVPGAAIGFNYDDPSAPPSSYVPEQKENEEEEEDSDIDFDVCMDVNKVSTQQAHELNTSAQPYGMEGNDFFSFLTKDREEADNLKLVKELEEEKAMYSGRKSRRERRAYREKKLAGRVISPPSYASRKSPTYRDYRDSKSNSRSRSPSPMNSGKITYITSFGGEESSGTQISPNPRSAFDSHQSSRRRSRSSSVGRYHSRRRSRSRSHSRTRSRYGSSSKHSLSKTKWSTNHSSWQSRSRSRSVSRDRSPPRHYPVNKSKSRSPPKPSKPIQPNFEPLVKQPPAPIISRYYGRRGASSSSELSVSDDESMMTTPKKESSTSVSNQFEKKSGAVFGNTSSRNKVSCCFVVLFWAKDHTAGTAEEEDASITQ
ncbi:CLK4-associating serine/arginine rich protein isoform X2 [Cimex lectularius]|uniref:Suppressor of white apricot N-terminal domain-containing protein n=1 Tax=Cimex lectularius TaxID=79782 RepID=A0A8I6R7C4_CIMLE|nr:CLK4-associating serine/arginine rich protein isoform X2 [Cimex lectularius]